MFTSLPGEQPELHRVPPVLPMNGNVEKSQSVLKKVSVISTLANKYRTVSAWHRVTFDQLVPVAAFVDPPAPHTN